MNKLLFSRTKIRRGTKVLFWSLSIVFVLNYIPAKIFAQPGKSKSVTAATTPKTNTTATAATDMPKVTQIDTPGLQNLVKRNGENQKPLIVNFWATWCGPCVEEFPELVKIDEEYRGKIDFITISMDDLADINTEVPKFLDKMKAKMPAYLLKTDDEEAAIAAIAKDWQGALPYTVIYNSKGEVFYSKQGKIKPDDVRKEIDKLTANPTANVQITDLYLHPVDKFSYETGIADAKKDIADGKLIIRRYGLTPGISKDSQIKIKENYKVEYVEYGCMVSENEIEYIKGYNEISKVEIKRKLGKKASEIAGLE